MHLTMNLIHSILQLAATLIPLTFCENCEPITVSSCTDAGYKLTARFFDTHGEPYQDALADMLDFYVPLLRPCSKYASTILCSLYLPRCEEGRTDAKPPCRKVCKQFVTDCLPFLGKAGLGGTFTTLCNFLPDEGQNSDKCFYPSNFRNSSSEGPTTDVCYDVVVTKCKNDLHYNKTFVPQKLQNTEATLFEAVIQSNCSSKLEKFLCYTQFPPCNSTTSKMAFMPCKALCDEINRDCWKQFKKIGFKLPDCSFLYPQEESVTGLCQIKEWPAPWPKEFRPPPPALGTCEELKVKSCANAGYKFTAQYLPVEGIPFQKIKGEILDAYLPHLQDCSPYSSLILCSLFLPKCVKGSGKPMLPCWQVCFDFAEKCKDYLRLSSTAGMIVALCDLLPVYDGTPDKCILPDNFKLSSIVFSSRNVCHKVTAVSTCSDDLHYNSTFLPIRDQIASDITILQPIIDSKCSPDIEKYLCFTRLPPCTADTTVVHLPCREFCERILYDCGDVFKENFIPPLHCNFTFPQGDSLDGLCDLKQWPAPWPWKIPDPQPPSSAASAHECVPLTASVCADAGYDSTADYPPPEHDGRTYQQVRGESLEFFLQFLKLCSPYSSAVLCSLHMPKCVEGVQRPILPCRSVCLEFVHQCSGLLRYASHHGLFRGLCDLLPDQDPLPNTCFVPKGFKPSATSVAKRDVCKKVVNPKRCSSDLHYNQTFVAEADQTSVASPLQKIVDSGCSPELEKYLCYTSVPPCKPNDLSVYVPCRDVCEQVKRDCGGEFLKQNIPLPDCSWVYPDESNPKGLCQLTRFPAPWPYKRVETPEVSHRLTSNQGGVIAGIVFVIGTVIFVAVISVMYYRWRQGKEQFSAKRFDNVDPPREPKA